MVLPPAPTGEGLALRIEDVTVGGEELARDTVSGVCGIGDIGGVMTVGSLP